MNDRKRRQRGRKRRRHDFWRDWHDHRQKLWEETERKGRGSKPKRPFSHRQRARFWREFFHNYMGTWPENHWAFRGRRFNPWHQGKDAFNPLVASLLSKGGGLLPLYVLHLLAQQPRYGNEIMEKLSERTNGQWVANPGAIYPLMTVLEEQGFIIGKWEDPVKRTVRIYEITELGKKELPRLKAVVLPKLEETLEVLENMADDLTGDDTEWL